METEREAATQMAPFAQSHAIDMLAHFHKEAGPVITAAIARGQLRGIFLWLSVTLGPEAAAAVAYQFADELATRDNPQPFVAKKEMKP